MFRSRLFFATTAVGAVDVVSGVTKMRSDRPITEEEDLAQSKRQSITDFDSEYFGLNVDRYMKEICQQYVLHEQGSIFTAMHHEFPKSGDISKELVAKEMDFLMELPKVKTRLEAVKKYGSIHEAMISQKHAIIGKKWVKIRKANHKVRSAKKRQAFFKEILIAALEQMLSRSAQQRGRHGGHRGQEGNLVITTERSIFNPLDGGSDFLRTGPMLLTISEHDAMLLMVYCRLARDLWYCHSRSSLQFVDVGSPKEEEAEDSPVAPVDRGNERGTSGLAADILSAQAERVSSKPLVVRRQKVLDSKKHFTATQCRGTAMGEETRAERVKRVPTKLVIPEGEASVNIDFSSPSILEPLTAAESFVTSKRRSDFALYAGRATTQQYRSWMAKIGTWGLLGFFGLVGSIELNEQHDTGPLHYGHYFLAMYFPSIYWYGTDYLEVFDD